MSLFFLGPINISAQHSPTKNNRKSSYFFMDTKTEVYSTCFASNTSRVNKRCSYVHHCYISVILLPRRTVSFFEISHTILKM